MKTFNFTEGRIEGLQPRANGEAMYRDTAVPGLELRLLASGARAYCVRYRLGGRGSPQRRLTLGPAGEMRLDDARKAALKALAEVRHGGDPVAERKAVIQARADAAARTTVAGLVDLHEAEQRARGVASAADAAKMLRRDFVAAVGKGRNPAGVGRGRACAAPRQRPRWRPGPRHAATGQRLDVQSAVARPIRNRARARDRAGEPVGRIPPAASVKDAAHRTGRAPCRADADDGGDCRAVGGVRR